MRHVIWGLLLLGFAIADHPIDWERDLEDPSIYRQEQTRDTTYRLPENVIPLEYDIDIDLNFGATADREEYSFNGKVTIVVQALEENVTQIVLHANVDRINGFNIFDNGNTPVLVEPASPMVLESQYHFLRINLAQSMVVGANYTLVIDYSNTMNEGPLRRGIWRGNYTDWNGATRTYATTHFQPYNARQAFPCWDEPLFKAVFTVHLTHPTGFSRVYSNTGLESRETLANGRIRDNFLITPKMSSYLVTFLVSESFTVIAEDRTVSPPIRIIGRSNTIGLGFPVLTMAVRMTEYFDWYLGIPYSNLHPNLLNDHISSPDWASAGTENWGMVSYRELYMILDPSVTLMSVWHYSATLVSHELAHKWFGNLITCYWWSNTWINEGFASYFGYIGTYEVFPEFEHHEHFNSRYLQTSLAFDSGTGTVALNHDVNTPAQVTGHFGTISYSKGAAFLRMIADMIGAEAFRTACQYFLRDNAYEPTNATHLFEAFYQAALEAGTLNEYQNQNFDFSNYYYTWVNEPGYPILNVNIDYSSGQMTLTQERFFLNGNAPTEQIYPIPITYSTASNPSFTSLKPSFMMSTASEILTKSAGEEWVIFNNQQHGHYRVNYDEQTWQFILEALLNEPDSIHHLNRAQIVDDVFALMRSGRIEYHYGFEILKFLRHETNYHVWDAAITGYTWLRNRLRHIPSSQATFDSFILSYTEHVIESLGYDVQDNETPTVTMSRQNMLHFACLLGHERCIQESRSRFVALRENGQTVNPGIKRNVFVVGVREGGEEDYNYLFNRFIQSNYANDQLEMLRAMAATRDQNILLTRFLPMTLTFVVRTQDKVNAFNYALLGNPENADTVLEFVMNNIDRIRDAYQADAPNNPVHTVLSNLAAYLDESGLTVYENWLRTTQSTSAQFSTGINAITAARTNMAWGTRNVDIIVGAARDGAAQIIVSATILVVSAMFAIFV